MKSERVFANLQRIGIILFAAGLPISHVPAQAGIALAAVGWLGEGITSKRWRMRWHGMMIPLLLYLGWNILSAALSERPGHSLGAVLDNEWPLFIMVFIYWCVDDLVTLRRIVFAFLAASSIAVVYSLWQVFGGLELYRGVALDPMGSGFFRAVGFYGFYLTFAALAMTVFFFSTGFTEEMKKWYFLLLAGLSLLAVVGTFARSIWLALAAAIPVFAFTRGWKSGLAVSTALLVVVAAGILTVPALRDRAESILDAGQNETRLNLWKTSLQIAQDHPVLGIGEDNWDLVFDRYRVEGFYDTTVHAHNDYLAILVASGIPGLLAFLVTWVRVLASGFILIGGAKEATVKAVALGGTFSLMGLLIGGLFQNYYGTFINCLQWWFVVGLLLTAERIHHETNGAEISNSSPI
jgi:O-antigen ligase